VLATLITRHWEWVLIGALAFGGYALVQRLDHVQQQRTRLEVQLESAQSQIALVRAEAQRAQAAATELRRTLHDIRQRTETARAAINAVPDDGCLDRHLPAAVARVLHHHTGGTPMQQPVAAAAEADPGFPGADLARAIRLRVEALRSGSGGGGGQTSGTATVPGG
jgi:hypothetical protein